MYPNPFYSLPSDPNQSSALNTGVFNVFEDFSSIGSAPVTGSGTFTSDLFWKTTAIGANVSFFQGVPPDNLNHPGVLIMMANSVSGFAVYRGGGSLNTGFVNPSTETFTYSVAFELGSTATTSLYIGLSGNTGQASQANANTLPFVGLRYDTNLGTPDTSFTAIAQGSAVSANTWTNTGILANTGWHKLTVTGSGGSAHLILDNASPIALPVLPNLTMDFTMILVSHAVANSTMNVDYVGINVTGLTR